MGRFVDHITLLLASGSGGAGAVHFSKSPMQARGGPDGGEGGDGGDLIFSPREAIPDLSHLRSDIVYKAEDGLPGKGGGRKGRKGKNLEILLPEKGVKCLTPEGEVIKEIDGKDWCFLKGGLGGKGNIFYKSSRLQAPLKSQAGLKGLQKKVCLDLNLSTDVALLGVRSAGKTSFLFHVIRSGKKEQQLYPTSEPRVFSLKEEKTTFKNYTLLDLPGLNPDKEGKNLVSLKQVCGAKKLLFFISISNPVAEAKALLKILEEYDKKHHTHLLQKKKFFLFTIGSASFAQGKIKQAMERICSMERGFFRSHFLGCFFFEF